MGTALRKKPKDTKHAGARSGTHSKFIRSAMVGVFFFALMGFASFGFHTGQIHLIEMQFANAPVFSPTVHFHVPRILPDYLLHYLPKAAEKGFRTPLEYLDVLSVHLTLILLSALFLTLGTSDFKKTEWDLEWLVTLPVSKQVLMGLRILERTVSNPILILALSPPLIILFHQLGWNWPIAWILGLFASFPLLLLAATAQTILDTGVRLHWKPARIKNLQVATNLLGAALFYMISLSGEVSALVLYLKNETGVFFRFLPPGLLIRGMFSLEHSLLYGFIYLLISALGFLLGFYFLVFLLKDGVVSGSGQNSVRGKAPLLAKRSAGLPWFSTFTLRELRMLSRDHQYLAQTVLTPLLILFLQIYFLWRSKGALFTEARSAAAVALGMAGYSMMTSCYLCLVTEGPSLWIFYTFPRSMRDLIFAKVARWGWVALLYVLLFFFWCASQSGREFNLEFFIPFMMAFLGIPILVVIATALGVLGFEGPSATPQRRMKASSTYVYLITLAAYVACIFIPSRWVSFFSLIMMGLVAAAFWQKAEERLPYLLDPASVPPAHVSFSDGLIATQIFFILVQLFTLIQVNQPAALSGVLYSRSFLLAGLITAIGLAYYYRGSSVRGLPKFKPLDNLRSLQWGAVASLAALAAQSVYFLVAMQFHWFLSDFEDHRFVLAELSGLFLLSSLFSAFFQEYLFRGILFHSLQKSFGFWLSAIVSSLLFAFMHSPLLVFPSFILGITSAWAYRRSGSLAASLALHLFCKFMMILFFHAL